MQQPCIDCGYCNFGIPDGIPDEEILFSLTPEESPDLPKMTLRVVKEKDYILLFRLLLNVLGCKINCSGIFSALFCK